MFNGSNGKFEVKAVYVIVQPTQRIDYHGNKKSGTEDAGIGSYRRSSGLTDEIDRQTSSLPDLEESSCKSA
jgi:hypothetical protein